MSLENLENTLHQLERAYSNVQDSKMKVIAFIFRKFLPGFNEIYFQEHKKIANNFNIISELRAGENAHSRILAKILSVQNENNEYYFLKSFLKYLGEPFSDLTKLDKPKITYEKDRIDLRVRWENNSLIIENKIHFASDQQKQIESYIENEIKKNTKKLDNVYVLYLIRLGQKEPSEKSLSKKKKEELNDRFKVISFANTILPWLKNDLLPNCKRKEYIVESALIQYIEHLEEMFYKNLKYKPMEEKLKQFIIKELNLTEKPDNYRKFQDNINILETKISEFQKILDTINMLNIENTSLKEIFFWKEKIGEEFKDVSFTYSLDNPIENKISINIDNNIICKIGYDDDAAAKDYYFSFSNSQGTKEKGDSSFKLIENVFEKEIKNGMLKTNNEKHDDYYWQYKSEAIKEHQGENFYKVFLQYAKKLMKNLS